MRPRPVRAEDALFLYAQTPQQVGAVVLLDSDVDLDGLRELVASRADQIPALRHRLLPASGRWDRPRWIVDESVEVGRRITEIGPGEPLERIVGDYFAEPLNEGEQPWRILLVRGDPVALVVKAHHALGDSFALISELGGLFDGAGPPRAGRPVAESRSRATRVVRGLAGMALAPRPDPIGQRDTVQDGRREFAVVSLDARMVAITARRLGASMTDLVLAVTAGALGNLLAKGGGQTDGRAARAMVPRSLRGSGNRADRGNRTAGVLLDLPIGPMPLAERAAAIRAVREARLSRGDAEAAAFVLHAMNLAPAPLQRALARTAYTDRRFSLIVSVFPGTRRPQRLLGAGVTEVFPVLALADGVGLAIGAMTWGRSLSIGIMANPALVPDAEVLATSIRDGLSA